MLDYVIAHIPGTIGLLLLAGNMFWPGQTRWSGRALAAFLPTPPRLRVGLYGVTWSGVPGDSVTILSSLTSDIITRGWVTSIFKRSEKRVNVWVMLLGGVLSICWFWWFTWWLRYAANPIVSGSLTWTYTVAVGLTQVVEHHSHLIPPLCLNYNKCFPLISGIFSRLETESI